MNKKKRWALSTVIIAVMVIATSSARGDVTYTLTFDPAASAEAQQVANAIAGVVPFINQYGSFNKHWNVFHNTGIPTAEANYDGYMGYGGTRNTRVVFHEGAHTFGMGTTTAYANLISGGVWGGQHGNQALFDTYNTYSDGLHGDGHAIWPGGFNYDNEDGFIERVWMLRVMAGIRADMGILSYTKEAVNELVHPGETAEFAVESPIATGFQWYKGGVTLSNGGDISGATGSTLQIANTATADQGSYHCVVTGAGETLNSRPRQLIVAASQQLIQLNLDGNVSDSANINHGTAYGSPGYVTGKIGQAIDLDGSNDYIELPPAVGQAKNITVATWVRWDGGSNWQRIFDFGTGIGQFMFLTPKTGGSTMRLAFKDAFNDIASEQRIDAPALPVGTWVHLAAVLNGEYATLYVDGQAVGSVSVPATDLSDFLPTQNYIGKSQYSDPLFNGCIDDFRIYNHALDGSEIWNLWGQNSDTAPMFNTNAIVLPSVLSGEAFAAPSLTNYVYDTDGDALSFSRVDGPTWLHVAEDGMLSGIPGSAFEGVNRFIFRVKDPSGASSDTAAEITVVPAPIDYKSGPVLYWDFADAAASDGTFMPGNGDRADLNGDGFLNSDDFRIGSSDLSGNGNHLTAWTSSWMKWSEDSMKGDFSMKYHNNWPAAGTDSSYNPYLTGIDAETITPAQWTVEVVFKANATSGTQTMVGRDGRNVGGSIGDSAAFYLQMLNSDLRVVYVDVDGYRHVLQVAAGLAADTWYTAAGVSDGNTLRLYLDGSEIGSLDLTTSGTDTALGLGYGQWTAARGMWAGAHVDRFFGVIDAVAISGVSLAPGSFVTETFGSPQAPSELLAENGDSQVLLSWNAVSNAVSYSIKHSIYKGGPYAEIGSTTEVNFMHTGTTNGIPLYYVVSAVGLSDVSPNSAEVSALPSRNITADEYFITAHIFGEKTNVLLTVSNSVVGHSYQILATESLTMPDWQPAGTGSAGNGSVLQFNSQIHPLSSNRFFKVDVQRQ